MKDEMDTLVMEWELPGLSAYDMIPDLDISFDEGARLFVEWKPQDNDEDMLSITEYPTFVTLPLVSPTAPENEFITDLDVNVFSIVDVPFPEHSNDESDEAAQMSFQKRLETTAMKLALSMKRSQETRQSLVLKSPEMGEYPRIDSVQTVLKSVLKSTKQLKCCLRQETQDEKENF